VRTVLIATLCLIAIVPRLAALSIAPNGGTGLDWTRMQEAPDEEASELDSAQAGYYNVANQVHSRIIEVTNDIVADHQLIRIHWTVTSEVWIWAFKLRYSYFDENNKPIRTETRWMYSPNEDGSFNIVPPHSSIDDWHELTVSSEQATKFKGVSVLVEIAYQPD